MDLVHIKTKEMTTAEGTIVPFRAHWDHENRQLNISLHPEMVEAAKAVVIIAAGLILLSVAPATFIFANIIGMVLRDQLSPINDKIRDFISKMGKEDVAMSAITAFVALLFIPGMTALSVGQFSGGTLRDMADPRKPIPTLIAQQNTSHEKIR